MNPRTLALRTLLGLSLLLLLSLPAAANVTSGDTVVMVPMPVPGGVGVVFIPVLMGNLDIDPATGSRTVPLGTEGPSTQDPATSVVDDTSPTPG